MSAFPPSGPTNVLQVIPSYLYAQYSDDDDLQAFVAAFNAMAQSYVDWFNDVNLPAYTGAPISGGLLDWVGAGLYGMVRPTLSSGGNRDVGTLNTYTPNSITLNTRLIIGPQDVAATTDDTYKRILTWHVFKGDGKVFNIRWLKRRVMRFLNGVNGTSYNVDQTYQVSVTFGVGNQANINLITTVRTITAGAYFNAFLLNGTLLNSRTSSQVNLAQLQNAQIFREAVLSGVLELPFQFTWVVNIT